MIRQDDKVLNSVSYLPFEEFACAIFDIAYYGVIHGKYVFERSLFLRDIQRLISDGILDRRELDILNWDKVCKKFKLPYRLVIENGTHKLPADRELQDNELQLLYLFNPATGYHHFVCGNKYNQITLDSLGNSSVTSKAYEDGTGYIESKRVLRRI